MGHDPEPDSLQITYPIDGITVITMNRARRRNAVNAAQARKLYDAIIAFEEDPKANIAILNGANGTFCAGFDLHTIGKPSTDPRLANDPDPNERSEGPMGPSRLQIKKPM